MQTIPSNDEPDKHVVKQYKPCSVKVISEAWNEILNETMQTMPSDDEPGKNEVKQYKLCPVRTIHWSMQRKNTNHVQ